jgi:hypothetical protein
LCKGAGVVKGLGDHYRKELCKLHEKTIQLKGEGAIHTDGAPAQLKLKSYGTNLVRLSKHGILDVYV